MAGRQGDPRRIAKEQRQGEYLRLLRQGKTRGQARVEMKLGESTIDRWRREPGFRKKVSTILAATKGKDPVLDVSGDIFPDFLTFRERHFAYLDLRSGKIKRARNSWYQVDANDQMERHKRLIMVLPPGHIKTTLFSIERSVYDIMKNRNWRGTVVQKSEPEAKKLISSVQERLECDYYHWMGEALERQGDEPVTCPVCAYGGDLGFRPESKMSGEKWGAVGFRVVGRTSGEKDDTMQAKGAGSQIQGIRADRIVLDDVQDPMGALTSMKDSDTLMEWFHNIILGRVFEHQSVIVLANFITPDDFAHKLIAAHPDWPVVTYSAIQECERKGCAGDETCRHLDERVLCPDVWTYEALMSKRKEVGEQVWFYQWQQLEGSFDEQTFKKEVLEEAKTDEYKLGEIPSNVSDVFLGVDPAIAASGHCAMIVWGLDRNSKQRFLIDIFNHAGMANWDNVIAQILEFCRGYPVKTAIIEGNNQQKGIAFSQELIRGLRSVGTKTEIYQTATGSGARAEQSNFDISTIGGLFDAGLVCLPYGGPLDERKVVDDYIAQLCNWRTDDTGRSIKYLKRDMVMATLFAESEAYIAANRERSHKKPPRRAPAWTQNRGGGFRWQRAG